MSSEIIPLRRNSNDQAALARIDAAAAAMLSGGLAASLQGARAEVILTDLRLRRNEMSTLLLDIRGRELTGIPHINVANASLITAIVQGLVQIDLFIAQARDFLERTEQSGAPQPDASRPALRGV